MVVGILFTAGYIIWFKILHPEQNTAENWLFGISPEGIGTIGMLLNFAVALVISRFTPAPPQEIVDLIERIRVPEEAVEEAEAFDPEV